LIIMVAMAAATMAQAQPAAPTPADGADIAERVAQASSVGSLLYAFDRAAWVSSDALTAQVPQDRLTGLAGYIVEIAEAGVLRVTYYRGAAATADVMFVVDVRDGKVVRSELLAYPVRLLPAQARLARAREIAVKRARERNYKPCTKAPFNTVVLPSRDNGPVAVYLLSAQQKADTWPMGGNYRVIVAPDGAVLASRPYSVGCLNVTRPHLPAGAKPVGFIVSHLLDPTPTEVHVFASYSMHSPVFVTTPDKKIWKVEGRTITLDEEASKRH
jgi:hypothetical protein